MKRIGSLLLALALLGTASPVEAISFGVGIGFGRGGGVFGEVGTRFPDREECCELPSVRLTKAQQAQLTAAQAVTREIGYGVYETTVTGPSAKVAERLLRSLAAEGWLATAQRLAPEGQELMYITALPTDRLSMHIIGERPVSALYWQAALTVTERKGRTVIIWASPARSVREKGMDRVRGEELQARLVQALAQAAARS